jgi:hypothetical protein
MKSKVKKAKKLESADSKKLIRELLDIEPTSPEEAAKWNKEEILKVLKKEKVAYVLVHFDGGGDSGSIEQVCFQGKGQNELKISSTIDFYDIESHFSNGEYVKTFKKSQKSLRDAFESIADEILEETGVDWYNNEGGYGDIVFNVNEGTVHCDMNQRIVQVESSEHEYKW